MSRHDTIFAKATGAGVAAISIIRLSGPQSWSVVAGLTRTNLPHPRIVSRRWIYSSDEVPLDEVLILLFEDGASFTGEQSAEIHCHGGRAVENAILAELGNETGCRLAEPGEFTRRAFDAGRIGLNEAEGLADLLRSETEFQRRHALRVFSGAASDRLEKFRANLVRARALLEATIDWADEDVPEEVSPEARTLLDSVLSGIDEDILRFGRTERLRNGFEVAILGAPNVGKSSLLNAIAGRDVALTSETAGTTRDIIELRCDLGGLPVVFLDTAGIRDAYDSVESAGIERAIQRADSADLRIFLSANDDGSYPNSLYRNGDLLVRSKCDLGSSEGVLNVSSINGEGIDDLLDQVSSKLSVLTGSIGSFGHERQIASLEGARGWVLQARDELGSVDVEVLAEHLRLALADLDSLSGRTAIEDVLGEVFSTFCLGK